MKRILIPMFLLVTITLHAQTLTSPDGQLKMQFTLENGTPVYQLSYKNKAVLNKSRLGIEADGLTMKDNFLLTDTTCGSFDESWNPVWGNYKTIRIKYNELSVLLTQNQQYNRQIIVRFRLFNDGLGFRYEFPEQQHLNYFIITEEITEFNLTGNHKAFCMPGDYDTNEFPYTTALLSEIKEKMEPSMRIKPIETKAPGLNVQTPLMLKTNDGLYINIHEAALVNYSAMLLNVNDKNFSLSAHLTAIITVLSQALPITVNSHPINAIRLIRPM